MEEQWKRYYKNYSVSNLGRVTAAQNTQHAIKMNLRPQNISKN